MCDDAFVFDAVYLLEPTVSRDDLGTFVRYQGGGGLAIKVGALHTTILGSETLSAGAGSLCTVRFALPSFDGTISTLLSYVAGMLPLFPGITLQHLYIQPRLLNCLQVQGPSIGRQDIRAILGLSAHQTLFGAILKPPQLSTSELQERATVMLDAGVDVIKDDDLAIGSPSHVAARIEALTPTFNRAIERRSRQAFYLAYASGDSDALLRSAECAAKCGMQTGLMVAPALVGFDAVCRVRKAFPQLPIAIHTANMPDYIHLSVYLGLLGWLAGGDILVFPVPGHFRIRFTMDQAVQIIQSGNQFAPDCRSSLAAFGGGVTPDVARTLASAIPDSLLLSGSWPAWSPNGIADAFRRIRQSIGR